MNIIAIDIGNSNITVAFFLKDSEQFIKSVAAGSSGAKDEFGKLLVEAWEQIPYVESPTVRKRDGVIVVSSVKDEWTQMVTGVCKERLDEKIKLIGKDIPLPIEMAVDNDSEVGTDRAIAAAAAFAVVEDAVVVADFGTAVTIDLVDEEGVFMGGAIFPGFEVAAKALETGTAKLPKIEISKPMDPVGGNPRDAINCGLYYSAVGALETITRQYAEQVGKWPQTIVTGGAAGVIKDDCEFVDSWVPNLVVKGIVLAYKKFLSKEDELADLGHKLQEERAGKKK